MQWIRSHLSFANSISLIALFVALGGTSLAAVTLSKNSVGAKQIKKNAVGVSEIKKNAVRASEVNSNAVGASELRSNAVASGDIADNGVGGADLSDNSVGGGRVERQLGRHRRDPRWLAGSCRPERSRQPGPSASARVQADGTLELGAPPPLTAAQGRGPDGHSEGRGGHLLLRRAR